MKHLKIGAKAKLGFIIYFGMIVQCGTWVGNPSDDDEETETPQVAGGVTSGGTGSTSQRMIANPGDVFVQKLRLKAGVPFKGVPKFKASSLALLADVPNAGPLEISVVAADGKEIVYQRSALDQAATETTAAVDGDYTVLVKNNTKNSTELESITLEGATADGGTELGNKRANAPYQDILLKGVIALGRTCKAFNSDGSATVEVKAAPGTYFAQPFVFMGKVSADKKVTDLTTATVTLSLGDQQQVLTKIGDLPTSALADYDLPKDASVVRRFYQGYFGAAGELYTSDIFLFGGDCSKAVQFNLGTNVGEAKFLLTVKDASLTPSLDVSFPIRASVAAPFSMYTAAKEKLLDYTQCSIDRLTALPKTYNGDASSCKSFSFADPPYVQLDYKLPSETTAGLTKESDPNRVLFYGHAQPRVWFKKILEQASALAAGTETSITLPGCLNNGGLIAVPLVPQKTPMPLAEFNSAEEDVINLASRPGTFTSAPGFYQGNVDLSGSVTLKACIPYEGASCGVQRDLTVKLTQCSVKADSGIAVTSIADSFIYPSYFTMSGLLVK